jgi:hypothetical protein
MVPPYVPQSMIPTNFVASTTPVTATAVSALLVPAVIVLAVIAEVAMLVAAEIVLADTLSPLISVAAEMVPADTETDLRFPSLSDETPVTYDTPVVELEVLVCRTMYALPVPVKGVCITAISEPSSGVGRSTVVV